MVQIHACRITSTLYYLVNHFSSKVFKKSIVSRRTNSRTAGTQSSLQRSCHRRQPGMVAWCRIHIEQLAILLHLSGRRRPVSRILGGQTPGFHSRRTAVWLQSVRHRRPTLLILGVLGLSNRPRNSTTPMKRPSRRWWRHTADQPRYCLESPLWWRHRSARPMAMSRWLSVTVGTCLQSTFEWVTLLTKIIVLNGDIGHVNLLIAAS